MALFIYLLLGAVIISYELTRKKHFKIDLISFFNFFFFLGYSFGPAALLIGGTHLILADMPYGSEYFGKFYFTPHIILLSYLFFIAGVHTLSNESQKHNWEFKFWWSEDTIMKILPFAYLILFFFLFIYTNEIGGFLKAIELADAYRSDTLEYNKFGFVMKFFPLNTLLLYYTYYKYFLEKKRDKLLLAYFLLSAFIIILITVLQNSRGYLIFQFAGLYVLTVNYYKSYFLKYLIPTLLGAFIVIKYADPIFNSTQYIADGYDAFIAAVTERIELNAQEGASIVSSFTHPIVSLEASLARSGVDVEFRYFRDVIDAFLLILPNELLGLKEPEMLLMEQNSLLLQGRVIHIVLPAILGFFSYSGGIIGIFVGAYLYGLVGAIFMSLFNNLYRNYTASIVYYYLFSLSYGYFAFRGVPAQVLDDGFLYLVIATLLLFGSKLSISKITDTKPSA